MRVDHLIIGAADVGAAVRFYVELLGFRQEGVVGDGVSLTSEGCGLILHPLGTARLPSPAHVAFDAGTADRFERLLARAEELGLSPRSLPPRDSPEGPGTFEKDGASHRNFYVFDPSGLNVEVIVRLPDVVGAEDPCG